MALRAKQERVVEAVRHGLEGDAAVSFVRESGYAIDQRAIARHLRNMGGRGRVQELIDEGLSNLEILQATFPEADLTEIPPPPPAQGELFGAEAAAQRPPQPEDHDVPLYETTKLTLRVPADVYEALRVAAKAERKSQNDLIVEILTASLSRMPYEWPPVEEGASS